jgi:hypothetical protein
MRRRLAEDEIPNAKPDGDIVYSDDEGVVCQRESVGTQLLMIAISGFTAYFAGNVVTRIFTPRSVENRQRIGFIGGMVTLTAVAARALYPAMRGQGFGRGAIRERVSVATGLGRPVTFRRRTQ